MLQFLRDPLWQSVGVALAIAALAASFLIYSWQRSRRSVTYDVLSWTNLLTVREQVAGKVQVFYEGEPAKSLTLIVIRVWNSGNQPLLAAEFERPIAFRVETGSRILSAAVVETDPTGVAAEIEQYQDAVLLKPSLLNPADSVTIKLLVRDMGKALWPDARIAGVKQITLVRERKRLGILLAGTGLTLLAATAYLLATALPPPEQRAAFGSGAYIGVVTFILGYVCSGIGILNLRRARRRNARLYRPSKNGAS
jgi:hypothetical protein